MEEKKDKPPSRKRYEKKNPNWTVRMPLPWHEDYEIHVENLGLSRREFMGVSLEKIKLDYEQIRAQSFNQGVAIGHKQGYSQGHNDGSAKGKEEGRREVTEEAFKLAESYWKIEFYCPRCRRLTEVSANSWTYRSLIDFLYYFGWVCGDCCERGFYR